MYAFANDVLESVKIEAVQKRVKEQIADKLGVRLGFEFLAHNHMHKTDFQLKTYRKDFPILEKDRQVPIGIF